MQQRHWQIQDEYRSNSTFCTSDALSTQLPPFLHPSGLSLLHLLVIQHQGFHCYLDTRLTCYGIESVWPCWVWRRSFVRGSSSIRQSLAPRARSCIFFCTTKEEEDASWRQEEAQSSPVVRRRSRSGTRRLDGRTSKLGQCRVPWPVAKKQRLLPHTKQPQQHEPRK